MAGTPLEVRRRGIREDRPRPPIKSAHGRTASKNVRADALRGVAPERGRENRVCGHQAWLGQPRGERPEGANHGRKGDGCVLREPDLKHVTIFDVSSALWTDVGPPAKLVRLDDFGVGWRFS